MRPRASAPAWYAYLLRPSSSETDFGWLAGRLAGTLALDERRLSKHEPLQRCKWSEMLRSRFRRLSPHRPKQSISATQETFADGACSRRHLTRPWITHALRIRHNKICVTSSPQLLRTLILIQLSFIQFGNGTVPPPLSTHTFTTSPFANRARQWRITFP